MNQSKKPPLKTKNRQWSMWGERRERGQIETKTLLRPKRTDKQGGNHDAGIMNTTKSSLWIKKLTMFSPQ